MTKSDVERYKQVLLHMRGRLTGEVERIIEAVQQDVHAPGTIAHLPVHPADQASDGLDVEVDILKNEQDILKEVDEAPGPNSKTNLRRLPTMRQTDRAQAAGCDSIYALLRRLRGGG